ncbi:MAG: acyltransferase family protein [Candidatus Bathyarchaeota archaeon]|nr:acyltransferase family protein [Candidatus Bathyarchaeota archaeon]
MSGQDQTTPKNVVTALPVDLIRTVAIVLVILLHASIEPNPNVDFMSPQGVELWWVSNVYDSIGRMCIPLFVMLTGALLLQPSKAEEPLRMFFKKRWSRIGIPIIFWNIVFFVWIFTVKEQPFSVVAVVQGLLAGPYVHFWYLYVLIGLYLVTPLLRVIVVHADWKLIRYFLVVWFLGTGIIPLLFLCSSISPQAVWFRDSVFILTGLVGYYLFGAYATQIRVRAGVLWTGLILSTLWTILGTYLLVGTLGEAYGQFFLDASSISVILASLSLFLILTAIPNRAIKNRLPLGSRVLKAISQNTLPIYIFHVIVLEALQYGYLGFKVSVTTINPIISVPLVTILTLMICLAIFAPLKKLPYVKRIIG